MKQIKVLVALVAMVMVSGCSVDKMVGQALEKNPDLVFKVIEQNPQKFMETVQAAARKARPSPNQDAAKSQDEEFKNPKVAEITENRILGNKEAQITLVEYTDLECPFCSRGNNVVNELKKVYGDKLKIVLKHLPLPMHPKAMPAAMYYEAIAASQGLDRAHAWTNEVFSNQDKMRTMKPEDFFKAMAKKAGVNDAKVTQTLKKDQAALQAIIQKDMQEAQKFGFQGTPGFLVNGVSVRGAYPAEAFKAIIDRHLAGGKAPAEAGLMPKTK